MPRASTAPSEQWLTDTFVRQAVVWEAMDPQSARDERLVSAGVEEPDQTRESVVGSPDPATAPSSLSPLPNWLEKVDVGYDEGFVLASAPDAGLEVAEAPFLLRINGLGQLRQTHFESRSSNPDLNQFQLIRGRLIFSGNAFTPDFRYFVQLDGRSSSGDEIRLLDYFMEFDLGRSWLDLDRDTLVFKAGRYKVPFTFARFLSAREFQFTDRSVASMYFDLNRSLAWGLAGQSDRGAVPIEWEMALFNGFVTGGAEEFEMIRVVDSGERLGKVLPADVDLYSVNTL